MAAHYCVFCGNNLVETDPCPECVEPLAAIPNALAVWTKLREVNRMCCGGLAGDHLFFHARYWGCTKDGNPGLTVECGVKLYQDYAQTYYLYDDDSETSGVDFGEPFPLPTPQGWDDFYQKLHVQLTGAVLAAWDDDISTCETCGYHQHAAAPHEHN